MIFSNLAREIGMTNEPKKEPLGASQDVDILQNCHNDTFVSLQVVLFTNAGKNIPTTMKTSSGDPG